MRCDRSPDPVGRSLRLFVALQLPEPVRVAIAARAASQLGAVDSVRPVPTEGLHVTLCFLGQTAAAEVEAISACCRATCAGHGPMPLALGELVMLPQRRPRVVAMRIGGEGHERARALQADLARRLAAGGWYRPESRPFLAHVTVARVRSRARLQARAPRSVAGPAARPSVEPEPISFTADVVTLFQSRPRPRGASYEPLASVTLRLL